MKWNAQGQEVADDDPTGIYDEKPAEVAQPVVNDNAAVLTAYQQQLIQEAGERRRLQEENARLKAEQNRAPAQPTDERAFFETPLTSTRDLIRAEVQEAVRPINEFTQNMTRQQTYASLKQQMKSSGRFEYIDQLEALMDQAMTGVEPTVQNMATAYNTVLGFYISNGGELKKPGTPATPAAPVNNTPTTRPLPPHARPSAPAAVNNNSAKTPIRELNANEKLIMRHNGFKTVQEYLFYTEHATQEELRSLTDEQIKARIKEIFG